MDLSSLNRAIHLARELDSEELISIAVQRGCRYYNAKVHAIDPGETSLPNEILGTKLLCGPIEARFYHFRVGTMVLSNLRNDPRLVAIAAKQLFAIGRVRYVAELALSTGDHPNFWQSILSLLPEEEAAEGSELPGVSRLVSETRKSAFGGGPIRVWLRTS